MYEIGIDMGGTHTAVGLVDGLMLKDRVEFATDTEQGAEKYIEELVGKIGLLLEKNELDLTDISCIGMGVPGSFNTQTGMIEYANNLSFSDVPFRDILEEKLGKKVLIDNDANLAAWGEYLLSKSNSSSFFMVTLGTGIGCGIVLDGKLYRGVNFAEGEIGHMTIRYDGIDCNCGRKGCFEAYASASALVRQAAEAAEAHPDSRLHALVEGDVSRLNGRLFFQAVREEDETALAVRLKGKERICVVDAAQAEGRKESSSAGSGPEVRPVKSSQEWEECSWPFDEEAVERMKQSGVLLLLPWGRGSGRMAGRLVSRLEKLQAPVLGAVIYGAKDGFLRSYYGYYRHSGKKGGRA